MLELSQRISLEQKLSPQQILLSTLLQLPALNLEQRIKQELEINPTLEEGMEQEFDDSLDIDDEEDKEDESEDEQSERLENEEEIDWEKIHMEEDSYEAKLPKDNNVEEYDSQDPFIKSPQEELIEQLSGYTQTDAQLRIGEYIIYNLRDDGYLDEQMTLETIAHVNDTTVENVEKLLNVIQRLDPPGMGSRNLRECLMIQLENSMEEYHMLAYDIIRFAFDEFVNKKFEKIASIVDATLEDIKEAIQIINHLNPKPGDGFFNQKTNYIIPDFYVERKDGEFIVSLNEWNTPNLKISSKYLEMLDSGVKDRKAKSFVRKKIEAAKWFINSIEQRRITMLKVMNAIVKMQNAFFEKGPAYIKPMIMKEIAEIINMDISTVSRVSNRKYVQTEFGVFELKSFFTERMETLDGEEVSTRIIKEKIRQLCESEDKQKPLSDELISKKLVEFDYKVARRTVAKYREQLGIPVARLRREIT